MQIQDPLDYIRQAALSIAQSKYSRETPVQRFDRIVAEVHARYLQTGRLESRSQEERCCVSISILIARSQGAKITEIAAHWHRSRHWVDLELARLRRIASARSRGARRRDLSLTVHILTEIGRVGLLDEVARSLRAKDR